MLLQARSVEDGMHLKQFLSSQNLPESVAQVYKVGIVLGAPRFTTLSDRKLKDIYRWLTRLCPNTALPTSPPKWHKRIPEYFVSMTMILLEE